MRSALPAEIGHMKVCSIAVKRLSRGGPACDMQSRNFRALNPGS